ncbi:MAG: hypothetical protein D6732_22125, partial [Methanobacteriota archaeon]
MKPSFSQRINPFLDIFRTGWENRDNPRYAWRILRDGVCDGCALGTSGMRDWTMKGVHLCWIRLNLLRLNTMPPISPDRLPDLSTLRTMDERELRQLGRIPSPLFFRKDQRELKPISWEEVL